MLSESFVVPLIVLLIVSAGYISEGVEGVAGGSDFGVILTESGDLMVLEKYKPVDILGIAPEKGMLIVSEDSIFVLGNSALYLFDSRNLSFVPTLIGDVRANEYYAVCNRTLYSMPRLIPLGNFTRVILKENMALGIKGELAHVYYDRNEVLRVNLSIYGIEFNRITDFLYTQSGVAIVENEERVLFILDPHNNASLYVIKYTTPRVVRLLYFNDSVAYIMLRSSVTGESISKYIIAVYSFYDNMFIRYFFSYSVYFPYAFIGSELVNLLNGSVVFKNVLSVLDYSRGKLLLILTNDTLALIDVKSQKVLYARGILGTPYIGSVVGNRSAILLVRIVKNYSYAYIVEFSENLPKIQENVQGQKNTGIRLPPASIIFAILFYLFIILIVLFALKRR